MQQLVPCTMYLAPGHVLDDNTTSSGWTCFQPVATRTKRTGGAAAIALCLCISWAVLTWYAETTLRQSDILPMRRIVPFVC